MNDTHATTPSLAPPPGTATGLNSPPQHPAPIPTKTTTPAPEPQPSDAFRIIEMFHNNIREWTGAPDDICSTLAFWALSTWYNNVLPILPSLVISGPHLQATQLLRSLKLWCARPSPLLAGFRKGDIGALATYRTLLISEPILNPDMTSFLNSMTSSEFVTVNSGSLVKCRRSVAICVGERSPVNLIANSISISVAASQTIAVRHCDSWVRTEKASELIERYVKEHSEQVQRRTYQPAGLGLSSEAGEVARSLGSCIIDDPMLQNRLIDLLRGEERKRLSHRSDSTDAIVIEATRSLSRKRPQHLYAREIADEANRLLELRGEHLRIKPETAGHRLRKIGFPTRRLTQKGNGLLLDGATIATIEQLSTMYLEDDCLKEQEVQTTTESTKEKAAKPVM